VSIDEIKRKYNATNMARHIEKHIRSGRRIEALAELIILCSGIRPSDVIEDVSVVNGEVWLIIYEKKTRRIRYVVLLRSRLLRMLMARSRLIELMIMDFLKIIQLAGYRKRLSEWLKWLIYIINKRRSVLFGFVI